MFRQFSHIKLNVTNVTIAYVDCGFTRNLGFHVVFSCGFYVDKHNQEVSIVQSCCGFRFKAFVKQEASDTKIR